MNEVKERKVVAENRGLIASPGFRVGTIRCLAAWSGSRLLRDSGLVSISRSTAWSSTKRSTPECLHKLHMTNHRGYDLYRTEWLATYRQPHRRHTDIFSLYRAPLSHTLKPVSPIGWIVVVTRRSHAVDGHSARKLLFLPLARPELVFWGKHLTAMDEHSGHQRHGKSWEARLRKKP